MSEIGSVGASSNIVLESVVVVMVLGLSPLFKKLGESSASVNDKPKPASYPSMEDSE